MINQSTLTPRASGPFLHILRTALACLVLLSIPSQSKAATSCTKMGHLVGIIGVMDGIVRLKSTDTPASPGALQSLIGTLNRPAMQRSLAQSSLSSSIYDVQMYLADVTKYSRTRTMGTESLAKFLLNSATFQTRHERMLKLSKDLCPTTVLEKITTLAGDAKALLGLAELNSHGLDGSPLQSGSLKTLNAIKNYSTRRETLRLLQVFLTLAAALTILAGLNFLLKLMHAIRLDRYSCAIPATAYLNGTQVRGLINVLGNRGLSFKVIGPATPQHTQIFTLDARTAFQTDVANFDATLTKEFDGSAGFRLSVPLRKQVLNDLLLMSKRKPRRKIEMGRKKKPAQPNKVSLALNSNTSPAE